jgi:DNA-directed RNA polymerase subunit RPC12/RpoP
MEALAASLHRMPTSGGAWMVAGGFWPYAELFKKQMELTYTLLHETGVDAMDPDHAPSGVPLRMEYSTFCQGWLPHLSPADGERLLKLYGLNGEYDQVKVQPTDHHKCGACGTVMDTLAGARVVVCEACGHMIDIQGGEIPCRNCGALLSFPVSAENLNCPYCSADTHRV